MVVGLKCSGRNDQDCELIKECLLDGYWWCRFKGVGGCSRERKCEVQGYVYNQDCKTEIEREERVTKEMRVNMVGGSCRRGVGWDNIEMVAQVGFFSRKEVILVGAHKAFRKLEME